METIKTILMRRDGLTAEEADEQIRDCREEANSRLAQGEMPFDICEEYFGLEPDYLEEIINGLI